MSLKKNPDERYQDVKEVLNDLLNLQADSKTSSKVIPQKFIKIRLAKYLAGVIILLLIVTVGFLWFYFSHKTNTMQTPLKIVPLTRYAGSEGYPSFSPDGNQVAFTWYRPDEDNGDIYIKIIGTESMFPLTTNAGDEYNPSWSPDGRTIAFKRASSDNTYDVFLISALGGPMRRLPNTITRHYYYPWRTTLNWHPNREFLVVNGLASKDEPESLFMISVQSGERIRLTNPPPDVTYGDGRAVFSSDGRKLIFLRIVSEAVMDLYLLELSESGKVLDEPKRITFQETDHYGAVFLPGDKEIAYSADSRLWRLALSENAQPKLIMQIDGLREIALSQQGDKLAFAKVRGTSNIARLDFSEKGSMIKNNKILIPSTVVDVLPIYSPDGQRIAFFSTLTGYGEVWVCDANGSDLLQVTAYDNWTGGASWSPDGQFLAIDTRIDGQSEIYIIPSVGGQAQRITNNPAQDNWPWWSKDGNWIYFTSNRTGRDEIWKISINDKEAIQLTQNGGISPKESTDGRMVYYNNSGGLWSIPSNGGNEQQILEQCNLSGFDTVEGGIYFTSDTDTGNGAIQYLSFKTGECQKVYELVDDYFQFGLSVSPDQKSILYAKTIDSGCDIDMIENFK